MNLVALPFRPSVSLPKPGTVLLVAPCHVIAEMDRDLTEFAARAGVDFGIATAAWNEYRPLFTSVDVRDLLDYLGGHPLVAPTLARHNADGPTAVLSTLLGVRCMSEDGDLEQVASGRAWLSHVIAATDAGRADSVTYAVSWGGSVTGLGVVKGAQRAYGALSASTGPRVANCAAGLVALLLLVLAFHEPSRRRVLESRPVMALRAGLTPAVDDFVRISNLGLEGHVFLRSVALPDLEQLNSVARLARALAGSPRSLTVPELAARLEGDEGSVERILDGVHCFQSAGNGRWRLGSSLADE